MNKIIEKYQGMTTPAGHELRVDEIDEQKIIIWYLFWGEYQGIDDHHHMGVARIREENGKYFVEWLRGTEQVPYQTETFTNSEDVFSALDARIDNC